MQNLFDLTGKVAVITGATKGIGKAIAEAYSAHGAKVVVSSRKEDACAEVAGAIVAAGGEAIPVACNISYKEQLQNLMDRTRAEWGRIDVLVCNAAVNPHFGSSLEIPDSAFEKVMTCNIQSNSWAAQMVIPGATKGIGKAIAEADSAHGAKVVVSSRKEDACAEVAGAIVAAGGEAIPVACNISYKEQLQNLMDRTREQWGQIDVLVCNAAVNPHFGSSLEIPDSAFEKVMTCNIQSNSWAAQMVIPEMRERKDGAIIIVSSIG
ncbi:MAG: SDR family NAD(P)-dependent oxidoreductase, partial [Minwuiales bacterium]|nr:SDR family NAD(P)-dependent oxidoreductase [Minwuiales bacterium]